MVPVGPIQLREGNGSLLQYSCLENPVEGGAWWAAVHRVAQSQTQLKRLSMHACIGEGNGSPLQYSCLENPRDGRAWWAPGGVCEVAQSQTQLKQLSSSSSSMGCPDTWVFRPCHVLSGLVLGLRAQWDWANIHFP